MLPRYFNSAAISTSSVTSSSVLFVIISEIIIKKFYVIFWSTSAILPKTSWFFLITTATFYWIVQRHCNIKIFGIIYLSVTYFTYAVSKRSIVFQYHLFIGFTFLPVFSATDSAPCLVTVMVPFTSMYTSMQSQKLNFNIIAFNLTWPLMLCVPLAWYFILTRLFALN